MKVMLAVIAAVVSMSVASPAEATKPVPGFHYKDVCKNIKGVQPAYLLHGTGPYRFITATKRPNDCREGRSLG